jgi:hypothetical protein
MIGISAYSKTAENLLQTRECVLNLELKIVRVYLDESILMDGHPNRVDPDKWRPQKGGL